METDLGLWVFKYELNLSHMNEFETQIKKEKKKKKSTGYEPLIWTFFFFICQRECEWNFFEKKN